MSMRTSGCATCAALLFLLAAGPAGAEGQTPEAEPIPESSTSLTAAAEAVETSAETELVDPEVDIAAGPVAEVVHRDTLGRTISTYYCRTVGVARVHRTFLGFVAFKFWQRKRWCWNYPRILSREVTHLCHQRGSELSVLRSGLVVGILVHLVLRDHVQRPYLFPPGPVHELRPQDRMRGRVLPVGADQLARQRLVLLLHGQVTRRDKGESMPNDGVNPTARWLARGIWKFLFVLVATLLVLGLVGLAVRAAFGAT